MNCKKCQVRYYGTRIELCPLHESAEKMLKALRNLINSSKASGTNNMVPAIEEARERQL